MTITMFQHFMSSLSGRMLTFLLNAIDRTGGEVGPGGLPAGAVHFPDIRLAIAATCCDVPLFRDRMLAAAARTGSDVLVMRHGLHPESLNPVKFDVIIHVNEEPCLLTDLVLYHDQVDGYWLVPPGNGAHVALDAEGLRLADQPPFITWHQRCDAVRRAASQIDRAARPAEAL